MTQTQRTNPYGSLCAEIYDIDKPAGSLPDVPFYLERLKSVGGPILEPACGSGRMLIPLMEAGHEVEGFDPSDHMLENLRRNCAARGLAPNVRKASFQDFQCARTFAAAICSVGTFTFVADFQEALDVLRRLHEHLDPGGLLMIDLPVLGAMWTDAHAIRTWTAANGDLLRFENQLVETDHLRQTSTSHMRYERWREGRLLESELEVMRGRFWGREEFVMALEKAGFGEVQVFGSYDRTRKPRRTDRGLTFEAVKA
ncbi:MAG TPA: class I SAM-dependent methyltransferase [Phenylobacterium sp.]